MLLVTHDPDVAASAQRAVRMKDGVIESGAFPSAFAERRRDAARRPPAPPPPAGPPAPPDVPAFDLGSITFHDGGAA